ncbi:MAG: M3 family metallopeptidase [Candidatus Bathyarchaeota archaeon]
MTQPDNPLLLTSGLPKFNEITPDHIEPAITRLLAEAMTRLEDLESDIQPTWKGLIEPIEAMGLPFEYSWGPIGHLLNVKNTEDLRKAHEAILPKVVEFSLRMGQSKPIYDGLVEIKDGTEWGGLDDAQRRAIELKIRDAKHAGVGLEGEEKERFNEISQRLSQLGTDFSNHVLDATKAYELIITEKEDTEGWPDSLRQLSSMGYNKEKETEDSSPEEGLWRITLEAPVVVPFLRHSRNRSQREHIYRAYLSRADEGELDNSPLIMEILRLKKEKAKLLGYESYADLSLASKMAPDVEAIQGMLTELFDASKPHQVKEFGELWDLAKNSGQGESLMQWDTAFWSERLKEKRFQFTDDQLRPYFPMPKVLEGMFGLAEYLFGISIRESVDESNAWHEDVQFFDVYENREKIAAFYLDAYSRPGDKRGGAWMDSCLNRRIVDGELRLPVVYLNANGTPPVGERPSLMSFGEVTTLFHEFGHGLQGMLTTVDYPDVSGINGVEWDAVETASQFMENWCYHEPILKSISGHWETGEPLPDDLVQKLLDAKVYMAGSAMVRQLEFGLTDMKLHSTYDPDGPVHPFEVHREIAKRTQVLEPLKEDHFLCAFTHIFAGGYAAGYYSYKWAEVLSADLYSAFEFAGFEKPEAIQEMGKRFRESFLALGGGVDPMKVFKDFMGREPSTEALLRHNNLL